jgi:hypothetical protein
LFIRGKIYEVIIINIIIITIINTTSKNDRRLSGQWTIARDTQDTMKIFVGIASSVDIHENHLEKFPHSAIMLTHLLLLKDYRHEKTRKSASGFLRLTIVPTAK